MVLAGLSVARASDKIDAPSEGASKSVQQPHVVAELIPELTTVEAGKPFDVALHLHTDEGWHTYWINPGDAGSPTTIDWILPPGWKAGAIQWPTPKRLPVLSLMDYGYEGTLWLLTTLTVSADAKPGDTVTLKAAAVTTAEDIPRVVATSTAAVDTPRVAVASIMIWCSSISLTGRAGWRRPLHMTATRSQTPSSSGR